MGCVVLGGARLKSRADQLMHRAVFVLFYPETPSGMVRVCYVLEKMRLIDASASLSLMLYFEMARVCYA